MRTRATLGRWIGEATSWSLVLSLLVGSSCESVNYTDCAIRCAPNGDCPSGLSCRDGFCSRGGECEAAQVGVGGVAGSGATAHSGSSGKAGNGASGGTAGSAPVDGADGGAGAGGEAGRGGSDAGGTAGEQGGAPGDAGAGGVPEPPWSPHDLSELVLWLDAGFGISTSGVNANLRVNAWQDRSGKGNHAGQSHPAAQPRFAAGTVGGRPAVEFNGQLTYLSIPDSETLEPGWQDFTMEIVAAWTNLTAQTEPSLGYGTLYNKQAASYPFTGLTVWANDWVYYSGQLFLVVEHPYEWLTSSGPPLNDGDFRLYGVRRVGTANGNGEIEVRVNGTASPRWPLTKPVYLAESGTPATIGGRENSLQQLVGSIAEIVFIRGPMSDDDLDALETYLNGKYSLW